MKNNPLWHCPKCGRPFAIRNQPHSCGKYTVEDFLRGKSPGSIALFNRFCELVESCGPYKFAPAKTRVGFQVRMIFAAVNSLSDKGMKAHVILARRLENPRFYRVESFSPRNHQHCFEIKSLAELDGEVAQWLAEAYKVGKQEHLRGE